MKNQIQYNEEIDFIMSLHKYFKRKEVEETDKTDVWHTPFDNPERLFVKNDLAIFFNSLIFVSFMMEFVEKDSLVSFLSITTEDFIKFMNQYVEMENLDQAELYEAYKDHLSNEIAVTADDYAIFQEAIFNTDSFRTRLNESLKIAFEDFRQEILTDDIKEQITVELNKHQNKFLEDPLEYTGFIQTTDPSVSDAQLKNIRPYLLHFSSGVYLFSIDLTYLIFSPEMPESIRAMNAKLDISDFLKTLSDPTRFKLVSKLAQKEYFGAELARELDVTTATISHHIDRLRKLKLLKLRKGEQSKIYFSLSHETFERYIDEFKKQLLGGIE